MAAVIKGMAPGDKEPNDTEMVSALAADPTPIGEKTQAQTQEHIYGYQLMTQQERAEYRAKMCTAKTYEEQDQIRQRHYNAMRIRARTRGVFLSEEPLVSGGRAR